MGRGETGVVHGRLEGAGTKGNDPSEGGEAREAVKEENSEESAQQKDAVEEKQGGHRKSLFYSFKNRKNNYKVAPEGMMVKKGNDIDVEEFKREMERWSMNL